MPSTRQTTPWLAITTGCCASSRRDSLDDDSGREALRANGETEMRICYDQPQTVPFPRAEPVQPRPSTSASMSKHVSQWVTSGRDFATRASSRASLHTLTRPSRSHSKPRPSIGLPMDFRHCDGTDNMHGLPSMFDDASMPVRRRRSFRPLELSIYLPDGRLSPLPDFDGEWDSISAQVEVPQRALVRQRDSRASSISSEPDTSAYLIQRKPVGSGSRRSSVHSQTSLQSRPVSMTLSTMPFLEEEPKSRAESPTLNRSNTFNSFSSLASPSRLLSRLPSPSRSRSNTASSRPGSMRRAKTDIDEAIRELNTIVEEKRADAYRSQTQSPTNFYTVPASPSHHVPAIAPSRRMHVRTETLSDIGSAFSVPLANKSVPSPAYSPALFNTTPIPSPAPSRFLPGKLTLSPPTKPAFGPLTMNPITPTTPSTHTPTTPIQRLGAWIKRSLPTTPSSPSASLPKISAPTTPKPQSASSNTKSFYQCEPPVAQPTTFSASTAYSRPSSAGSRTLHHGRQDSADTATVTLFSTSETAHNSLPSTPALSVRSMSPTSPPQPETPATPLRANILKGEGKSRRVPKPLVLEKQVIDSPLPSARSIRSGRGLADLKPPPSPNYNLLHGMEMTVGKDRESVISVSNVGVAF